MSRSEESRVSVGKDRVGLEGSIETLDQLGIALDVSTTDLNLVSLV